VLDIAASASHTSVRPSTTAQRNIWLLEGEGRCQLQVSFTPTRQAIRAPPARTLSSSATPSRSTRTWRPTLYKLTRDG